MSPAITDGERFGGFHVCQIRLSDSASWSFCLIGVLIGVVRVIFCAPRYLPFLHREQNIAADERTCDGGAAASADPLRLHFVPPAQIERIRRTSTSGFGLSRTNPGARRSGAGRARWARARAAVAVGPRARTITRYNARA